MISCLFMLSAMEGIKYYITPQWSELLNIKVWYAAVTQSFFSLSVGFGALFTYSSYNGFRHNVYRDALIISFTDTFTSLLAGKLLQYVCTFLQNIFKMCKKVFEHGRIRTCNLLIRSQTRYPLRHEAKIEPSCWAVGQMWMNRIARKKSSASLPGFEPGIF